MDVVYPYTSMDLKSKRCCDCLDLDGEHRLQQNPSMMLWVEEDLIVYHH